MWGGKRGGAHRVAKQGQQEGQSGDQGAQGPGGGLLADQPPSPSCILTLCDTKKQTNGVCPVLALGTLSRSLTSGQIRRSPQRKA